MSFINPETGQFGGPGPGMRFFPRPTAEREVRPPSPVLPDAPPAQRDARARLDGILDLIGLPTLKDSVWKQIQQGATENQLLQFIYGTTEYRSRYSGLVKLRERAARGEPVEVPNEQQYNSYVASAEATLRFYNVPKEFFDTRDELGDFMAKNVSLRELEERITEGYVQVATAPAEVRDAFAERFGVQGDSMLAAYFLDPERGEAVMDKAVRTSQALGFSRIAGGQLTGAGADRVAGFGVEGEALRQGVQQIAGMNDLLSETISEKRDLSADKEGVDAVFGGNIQPIRRRARERTAAFGGGGGAAQTQTGLALGSSE